ncbi:MAG: hypothetical protein M1142_06785 [Patescibacteria group bacterium]|nr:hypothetical protein [Patescibacteria group bacterium]
MEKHLNKIIAGLKKDVHAHKLYYGLVLVILICATVLRVWRIDQLLGFYYDQGRDAIAISKILDGNLTLIGPTTGIEGVFLGPFYYYFLAPGYFLGQGNPVVASYWQTLVIMGGLLVTFFISRIYFSFVTGIFSLFLMTFSFSEIKLDRWLSNPTPALFFAPLAVLFLSLSFSSPLPFLPLAALSLGILLQLEASSGFFLTVVTFLLIIVFKKRFNLKVIVISVLTFGLTLLPQILFELRHNFLLTKTLFGFAGGKVQTESRATFQIPTMRVIEDRLNFYSVTFLEKLKLNFDPKFSMLFVAFLIFCLLFILKNWSKPVVKVMAFWFLGLLLCFLFYNGNYGQINTYYFVTVFPIFFIFAALFLEGLWKINVLKPIVVLLLALFLYDQLPLSFNYLSSGVDGDTTIALGNQVEAVKYVINDASNTPYNWDAYVPPIIPYTYTYLFQYYSKKLHKQAVSQLASNLYTIHETDYTIHETDTSHPERENTWLKRQDSIGKIIKTVKFGGVVVERRNRVNYN